MHLSGRLPSHSEEWARQSIALKGSVVLGSGFSLGILGLILSVLVVRPLPAQAIGQGFELERAGQYDQAAAIYFATLRAEPTNLSALLGLERVLPPINRLGELLPAAQRAAAASPSNVALRGVLLRTYVALNEPDSGRAVALRWAAAAPGDEAPYREWAMALEDAHRHGPARDVLLLGRRALGRPGAFGIELAALSQRACARARALRRPGARGGRGGRPGARRRGARFHRGRRSGRRARRARTGRAGLECTSRRPTTGAARRGRGPDRGGTAQRGSAAARDQCPAVPRRPRQPTPAAGARPNCGRRVGPRRHGAGARLERRGTRAAGVDRPVSREVERGPAVVSRRGAVRRRPTRRRRPHDDGRPAAAGRPSSCGRCLTACGWASGNGG